MLSIPFLTMLLACGEADKDNEAESSDTLVEDGVTCDNNLCILSGTITEDVTLTADNQYLLRGGVFIGDDETQTVLTIEAGTTIYGETSTDGMLVIRRHSQIMAQGTAEAPIVMTSSKEPGTRARGDWGGLIINGLAPINACSEDSDAGPCEGYGEGATGWYGGDDPADNSGVLNYVRVEFAGTLISPDNELNGIAFQGVGSGTEIDYIQVHMNADDGIEFFGGTAHASHLVVTGAGDDSLDWTDGWQGSAQYVVLHQHDDNGDNGIEADNNAESNDASPRSNPTLSNLTIIGSPDSEDSDQGILLREGTAAHIMNTVVVGFNDSCLDIDHDATWNQTTEGNLILESLHLNCATNFDIDDDVQSIEEFFSAEASNSIDSVSLVDPYNLKTPDYSLSSSGLVAVDPSVVGLEAVDFVGAIGTDDWTAIWTTHELN